MAKNTAGILSDIIAFILSGGKRTTADNTRTILNEIAVSYPNFLDDGKKFETEVGYKGAYRPSSPNAFATVDMLGVSTPSNPTSIQYWKDSNNVVWKVTIGTDGIFQSQATTAPPTSPGFTYTLPLTLS